MTNYTKGRAAEYQYLYRQWLFRFAGQRSYGSKGIFDMIFIDKNLHVRLVQLKKGKNPRISNKEKWDIETWIDQCQLKGISHIWIGYVLWKTKNKPVEVRLN